MTPMASEQQLLDWDIDTNLELPIAGESAALTRWRNFQEDALENYDQARNIPGIDGTSRMSPHTIRILLGLLCEAFCEYVL